MGRSLNIKNLLPRKNAATKQGYYKIIYPEKYVGDYSKIIFRSSWEQKFATFCDINAQVVKWSSESIQIPYLHPIQNKTCIYNLDFYMKVRQADGTFTEFIIEVKPSKKLEKPTLPTSRLTEKRILAHNEQMKEYAINMHKFQTAKKWAEDRGWQFMIVTEKFLYGNQ